jgi:hypothetical protein
MHGKILDKKIKRCSMARETKYDTGGIETITMQCNTGYKNQILDKNVWALMVPERL